MSSNLTDGVWCDLMMCHIVREHVALDGVVVYQLAYKNAPHMAGAIKRAKMVRRDVRDIIVYAPHKRTVRYKQSKSGEWASVAV